MNALIKRLHNNGPKPGGLWFLVQGAKGQFPAVIFEPKGRLITKAATILGRDGDEDRWILPTSAVKTLAETDHVAQRWFSEVPHGGHVKIFVLLHQGSTLLVNWQPGGWYIEPGSLDADVMQ